MAAQPTTFADAMTKVLQDLAAASVMPDSNLQLCIGLQAQITSALRKPPGPAPGQPGMPQGMGGMPNGPGIPGGLGGQQTPMAGPPGGAGVQPAVGQQPPNIDDVRQMLAQRAGA